MKDEIALQGPRLIEAFSKTAFTTFFSSQTLPPC